MLSIPNERLDDGIVEAAMARMDLRGQLFGDLKPAYIEVLSYLRESHQPYTLSKPDPVFDSIMRGIKYDGR